MAPEFVQPLSSLPVSIPGTVAHLPEPCPSEPIFFKAPIFHGSLLVFVFPRRTEPIGYMHSYIGLPNRKWNSQPISGYLKVGEPENTVTAEVLRAL